ncbi:PIN domain-containing protein [Mangrovicella endophytica]|uniref:PIN domain-containing protein n=1 Tax=Mangrovicella endophytica TaxID=2066697 RepID=UPI000C9E6753|nr:PIN domain-containing protein [Mangrovicella endophytica]
MRYLLDTNIISDAVGSPTGRSASRIRDVFSSASIVTSIIVVSELRYGYTKISSKRLRAAYELFFSGIPIEDWEVPFDHVYADIRSALDKNGHPLGAMDMLIAAHAMATDAVLVTADAAFRHVGGLRVENWLRDEPAPQG